MDLAIGKAEAFIEAITADQHISDLLGCQIMDPFICFHAFVRFASGEPLEIGNYYIRADSYKFKLEISTDDLDLSAFD